MVLSCASLDLSLLHVGIYLDTLGPPFWMGHIILYRRLYLYMNLHGENGDSATHSRRKYSRGSCIFHPDAVTAKTISRLSQRVARLSANGNGERDSESIGVMLIIQTCGYSRRIHNIKEHHDTLGLGIMRIAYSLAIPRVMLLPHLDCIHNGIKVGIVHIFLEARWLE